jgi:hypothetical protein
VTPTGTAIKDANDAILLPFKQKVAVALAAFRRFRGAIKVLTQ